MKAAKSQAGNVLILGNSEYSNMRMSAFIPQVTDSGERRASPHTKTSSPQTWSYSDYIYTPVNNDDTLLPYDLFSDWELGKS